MSGEYRPGGAHIRAAREESGLDSFHQLDAVRVFFCYYGLEKRTKESHIVSSY